MRWSFTMLACFAITVLAANSGAHPMRSGSLRLEETSPGHGLLQFTSRIDAPGVSLTWPGDCRATPLRSLGNERTLAARVDCTGELSGRRFGLRGLGPVIEDATLFVRFQSGRTASCLLTRAAPDWELPRAQTAWEVAKSYVRFGLEHIATGADHLAFLALLTLSLRRVRAVLVAETAFTVSHSLSFTGALLGWIRVPAAAAEACIALSLVLLALDVPLHGNVPDGNRSATRRAALMALVFGFVHGLGFAGGLQELGVPDHHVALALIGFAGGVELGQVAFLALSLLLLELVARQKVFARVHGAHGAHGVLVYALGALSSFWLIDRVAATLGG